MTLMMTIELSRVEAAQESCCTHWRCSDLAPSFFVIFNSYVLPTICSNNTMTDIHHIRANTSHRDIDFLSLQTLSPFSFSPLFLSLNLTPLRTNRSEPGSIVEARQEDARLESQLPAPIVLVHRNAAVPIILRIKRDPSDATTQINALAGPAAAADELGSLGAAEDAQSRGSGTLAFDVEALGCGGESREEDEGG